MDTAQVLVTFIGLLLVALVVWFFFFAPHQQVSAVASGGVQQVSITVQGGYSPNVVEVKKGQPVQLHFYRAEEGGCSEELLLPDFLIRRELPAFQTTTVELLPRQAGRFEFTCGMHMLRGSLVVV